MLSLVRQQPRGESLTSSGKTEGDTPVNVPDRIQPQQPANELLLKATGEVKAPRWQLPLVAAARDVVGEIQLRALMAEGAEVLGESAMLAIVTSERRRRNLAGDDAVLYAELAEIQETTKAQVLALQAGLFRPETPQIRDPWGVSR